jgi:hypothetical protein
MTIQTITPNTLGQPDPTDPFQAGIRDARTEATTTSLDIIWARAQWMTDPAYAQHTDASYLLGYTSTLAALTNQIATETAFGLQMRRDGLL